VVGTQHNRSVVVRKGAFRLRVDTHKVEILPHLLQKAILTPVMMKLHINGNIKKLTEIPLVVGRDRDAMNNLRDDIHLFHAYLVDFVEH